MASSTRPCIGINAEYRPANKVQAAFIHVNAGYFDNVAAAGGLPVVVPPLGKEIDLDAWLDRLDGFVLTGSAFDLDPRRLNMPPHLSVQPMAERRFENDRLLVRRLLQRRIPLLAIGLGVQQVNVACGGTLFVHLPEEMPRSMPHRDPTGAPHRHLVLIEPNTRIEEIYGAGEIRVNSSHHQAIRQVGEGLRVGARAADGVIESIESTDPDWFCVGVQWHPESETASALDLQLFEYFVQACLRQSSPLELAA
jgi:putative glutamine amidotransferase